MTASANVLSRLKLKDFSTIKVAEEAGVSIGSLYQYFSSKEALITFYIERQLSKQTEIFESEIDKLSDLPMPEFTRRLVGFIADYLLQNPTRLKSLYVYAGQFDRMDLLMHLRHKLINKLAALFETRGHELNVRNSHLSATVLVHACMGVLTSKIIDVEMAYDKEAIKNELVRLIEAYLESTE